jgi:hypothetical protein
MARLNIQQQAIVNERPDRHICVIARAGTGKTTTILHRIKVLIDQHHINPAEIVLTTFTSNAAQDMRKRLRKLCPSSGECIVGTLDSLSQRHMRRRGVNNLDFTEYQRAYYDFLAENSEDAQEHKKSVRYFIFDEFQDVNQLQVDIMDQFHAAGSYIMVVGDNAQNIYTFRGSRVDFILEFMTKYQTPDENVVQHHLTINYRSTPQIIDVANVCLTEINEQEGGDGVNLQIIATNDPFTFKSGKVIMPMIFYYRSLYRECNDVMKMIRGLTREKFFNIAVLSRNNSVLAEMEAHLLRDHIDCIYIDSEDREYVEKYHNESEGKTYKILLTTIHGAKGLEWDYVFLLGMSDQYMPGPKYKSSIEEDRRLFYVAITRAKKCLVITYSGKTGYNKHGARYYADYEPFVTRYISEIQLTSYTMFQYINCNPLRFKLSKLGQPPCWDGVTKLIKGLEETDYHLLTQYNRLPGRAVDCIKLYEAYNYEEFIKSYYAFDIFGTFIEQMIQVMFQVRSNKYADGIVHLLKLSDDEYKLVCLLKSVGIELEYLMQTSDEVISYLLNKLIIIGVSHIEEQIKCLRAKVTEHAYRNYIKPYHVMVAPAHKIPQEFMEKFKESYRRFKNTNLHWSEIIYDIYIISLAKKICVDKRWAVLYYHITRRDLARYMDMYEDIEEFYVLPRLHRYHDSSIVIEQHGFESKYGGSIYGEADLLFRMTKDRTDDHYELTDVKVTPRVNGVDVKRNRTQLQAYVELMPDRKIDKLSIFNPLRGEIHYFNMLERVEYDNAVLLTLINVRDRKIEAVINSEDEKSSSR